MESIASAYRREDDTPSPAAQSIPAAAMLTGLLAGYAAHRVGKIPAFKGAAHAARGQSEIPMMNDETMKGSD